MNLFVFDLVFLREILGGANIEHWLGTLPVSRNVPAASAASGTA
jgi:hypothetical protein